MRLQRNFIIGLALTAGLAVGMPSAFAQYRYQTPNGHQTVGPSQMPQQPMPAEEHGQAQNTKVVPPMLDIPGVPNFAGPNTGSTTGGKPPGGMIPDKTNSGQGTGQSSMPQNKNTAPQAPVTAPGGASRPGALVLPQGIPSTVRTGPIEPISIWTRVILGFIILLQLAVTIIVAIALQARHLRDEYKFQGGHLINEDYREDYSSPDAPVRRAS